MSLHSVYQWRLIQENVPVWSLAEYLLRDLHDYPVFRGQFNLHVDHDLQQTENFLTAFAAVPHDSKGKPRKVTGPVAVISGDLSIADWKKALGKLSVSAAAELVLYNFLYEPSCDFAYGSIVLRRVLTAWAELQLADHGIRINSPPTAPEAV
jgi:hypothetical protein